LDLIYKAKNSNTINLYAYGKIKECSKNVSNSFILDNFGIFIGTKEELNNWLFENQKLIDKYYFEYDNKIHVPQISEDVKVDVDAIIKRNVKLSAKTIIRAGTILNHNVFVGNDTIVDENVFVAENTKIGARCHIGSNTILSNPKDSEQRITIGNNVIIGANCIIASGITIEENAVILPNSVVLKDVLVGQVISGSPAKVIKRKTNTKQNSLQN